MVQVILAGTNVPIRIRHELEGLIGYLRSSPEHNTEKLEHARLKLEELINQFTPEVICAAYARISRSKKNVDELLEEALKDIPRARKSNEAIIFGMGHHSVADHAIFNFNIRGASRLLIEEIEKRRIGAGYTEKSQRYVTFKGDFVKPREYSDQDLRRFEELVKQQNEFYHKTNKRLSEHLKRKFAGKIRKLSDEEAKEFVKQLEGRAKEDARYALSLATKTQLGCSYTGQTLELAIRRGRHGRLQEEAEWFKQLFEQARIYAPSLIQLADPELFRHHNPGQELKDDYFKYAEQDLRRLVEETFRNNHRALDYYKQINRDEFITPPDYKYVTRVKSDHADTNIIAALLYEYSKEDLEDSYALARLLIKEGEAEDFMKKALKHLSEHDKVPRAFEMSSGLIYGAIISATCFAQLKRHRMMTLLSQDYDPGLGFTTPQNIEEIGADKELRRVINNSSELYYEFLPRYGKAAEYCLTNAHRRRVLISINMRELYHVSRLREDEHAQWEIRTLVKNISRLEKEQSPISTMLLGGKHEFQKIHNNAYSEK
ncbi:MAG TPA: FAD-dependent thymidylate synthase [Candidatus Woesearchaeota archaeon]|nr:FAD-dependent thymidylate synthase [Candidatus Woesearchaeota archaeon]